MKGNCTLMEGYKKSKSPNFTLFEVALLKKLILKHKDILECKKTDHVHNSKKAQGWTEVEREFNNLIGDRGIHRDHKVLKMKWENIKKLERKKSAETKNTEILLSKAIVDDEKLLKLVDKYSNNSINIDEDTWRSIEEQYNDNTEENCENSAYTSFLVLRQQYELLLNNTRAKVAATKIQKDESEGDTNKVTISIDNEEQLVCVIQGKPENSSVCDEDYDTNVQYNSGYESTFEDELDEFEYNNVNRVHDIPIKDEKVLNHTFGASSNEKTTYQINSLQNITIPTTSTNDRKRYTVDVNKTDESSPIKYHSNKWRIMEYREDLKRKREKEEEDTRRLREREDDDLKRQRLREDEDLKRQRIREDEDVRRQRVRDDEIHREKLITEKLLQKEINKRIELMEEKHKVEIKLLNSKAMEV